MDKNAIKKYAVWARKELISRVIQKAEQYEITEEKTTPADVDSIRGRLLTDAEKNQRKALIEKIKADGFEQVMEEVAYTWFNRFTALRFMEVNNYLPSHTRVFTNEAGEFKPQILAEAIHLDLDGLDMDRVYELKEANKSEELYKYLLITQCNALYSILPGMFQKIEDYTELLLPDYLLREGSVIERMVNKIDGIPEQDWTDQVQIIGWLYQYYNSEPKDAVFASLKKNVKITKENIPAVTQLFTPDWIVRYMVENSLGRLWLEGHPNDTLKSEWKYYLDETEQEAGVQKQLDEIYKEYAILEPEDIRVIDPCMGSGHILCYLFDVLMQIYESSGYSHRDAARSIVRNNLYGLDIDKRATQLSYFSVMMKARQYDRRFFTHNLQPIVYCTSVDEDGENFGSLSIVDKSDIIPTEIEGQIGLFDYRTLLAQKYHVVVTNPPYMAVPNGNGKLQEYVKKNFPDSKADLFAVFIERCGQLTEKNGYQAMITQHAWMFLSSFEKLRRKLQEVDTVNMAHLGPRAFEEIGGEVVQTTSFVLRKSHIKNYKGTYCRLIEPTTQQGKEEMFLSGENRYTARQDNFSKIPGAPVAYWVSEKILQAFEVGRLLENYADCCTGMQTGNNNLYVRYWYEISIENCVIKNSSGHWKKYNCGGESRRWYGNYMNVVNWGENGDAIKAEKGSVIRNEFFFFHKGISWKRIGSSDFMLRYLPEGFIFDQAGDSMFAKQEDILNYLLAYVNTNVARCFFETIAPTMNLTAGNMNKLPVIINREQINSIDRIVRMSIDTSRADWDSFETSWDFRRHPLVRGAATAVEAYAAWEIECEERFQTLKANEEELNCIFIDIYGLQDELTPEVEDKDVTVRRAELGRDVRSLLSYAVGCMFGRYSLDMDGLAYAGGAWDDARYKTFQPDNDAIIPICDDEYFDDDIVSRFVKFIEVVYGKEMLEENLKFIADALGGKGTSREVIRSYFMNNFYADHLKVYQKRPIYWLFDSGKKNGFKCLIYMHRYRPDTIARIRTDYVHEQQSRYRTAIEGLVKRMADAATGERVKLNKQLTKLQAQAEELRIYEEKIHHLADQMISIDLDDGVKHNYALFQDVLAKIK